MPVPKTDDETMADWSPQEQEFWDWTEKNTKKIMGSQRYGAEWNAYQKLMKQAWPDPSVLEKYEEWAYNWHRRLFVRDKYFMNTEDYIEMISQANFLDTDKVEAISRNILIYPTPFVAIGETNFGDVFSGYGFTPVTDFLEPKCPGSDSDVLGNMILALNIHASHSPPLSPGSSVHSFNTDSDSNPSASTELPHIFPTSTTSQPQSYVWVESSDITRENTPDSAASNVDLQTPLSVRLGFSNVLSSVLNAIHRKAGHLMATILSPMEKMHAHTSATCDQDFVFVQLGLLRTFTGDWEKVRDGNPIKYKRGEWKPTGFAVVVRLSPKGKPGEVYVIHHPDPEPKLKKFGDDLDEYFCEGLVKHRKSHRNKQKTSKQGISLEHYIPRHPHPKSNSSFWIAKIADSIQDMGSYKRKFEFDVISSEESQIVNAKIWTCGLDGPALKPVREPDKIDI